MKTIKHIINNSYGLSSLETSKTDMFRVFCKKYTFKETAKNRLMLIEAIGYLRGLEDSGCKEQWLSEVRHKIILYYMINK